MKVVLVIVLILSSGGTFISGSAENPNGCSFRPIGDREFFQFTLAFLPNDLSRNSWEDLRETPVSDTPSSANSYSSLRTTLFELEEFKYLIDLFTSNKSKKALKAFKSGSIEGHICCFPYLLFKYKVISYLRTVVLII